MRISDWSSDVCSSDLAQRGEHQRLRVLAEHLGAFAAALPLREGDRLGPDLVVAQFLEFRLRPRHRARVGLGAGQARADLGGQRFGDLPAQVAGQRLFAQLLGLRERRVWNSRLAMYGCDWKREGKG